MAKRFVKKSEPNVKYAIRAGIPTLTAGKCFLIMKDEIPAFVEERILTDIKDK